jgi:hypothetical protein
VFSGAPFVVFRQTEPDHRTALRTDEILARQSDGPTKTSGLGNDLIQGVHRFRPSNPWDRLHLLATLEELHAERDRPQLQKALQIGDKFGPVGVHHGISRRRFGSHVNLDPLG